MESNRSPFSSIWSISSLKLPDYLITETEDLSVNIYPLVNVFDDTFQSTHGVNYDINKVSSRNARKNEQGPYKNSFLREIISSHNMGKASGTKSDLVATILNFHENKSK